MAEVSPNLVLLDFMMPLMKGGEVAQKLRTDPATQHIKIVMNSSLGEPSIRNYFADYDAFIRKPYNFDDLLAIIRRLLR